MASFDNNTYEITNRGVVPFGVPFMSSGSAYGANANTAFDLGPRGKPSSWPGCGIVWFDMCSIGLIQHPNDPVDVWRFSLYPDKAVIQTTYYNGGKVLPLDIMIGSKRMMRVSADGVEVFGKIKARTFEGGSLPDPEPEPNPEPQPEPEPTPGLDDYTGGGFFRESAVPVIGAGDFTIDWHMDDAAQTTRVDAISLDGSYTTTGWFGALLNYPGAGKIAWFEGTAQKIAATVPFNDGELHHCAVVRKNAQLRFYFDGQPVGAAVSSNFGYGRAGAKLRTGTPSYSGGGSYVGKLGGPRVTLSALWDGAFTPPLPA